MIRYSKKLDVFSLSLFFTLLLISRFVAELIEISHEAENAALTQRQHFLLNKHARLQAAQPLAPSPVGTKQQSLSVAGSIAAPLNAQHV